MSEIRTWEEMESSGEYDDYETMARAFAKMHVTAALKAAVKHLPFDDKMNQSLLDERAILNSYPLEKIK